MLFDEALAHAELISRTTAEVPLDHAGVAARSRTRWWRRATPVVGDGDDRLPFAFARRWLRRAPHKGAVSAS